MMSKISDSFISVIAPLSDDERIVEDFVREVHHILTEHYSNYELILVDDGSRDGTVALVNNLLKTHDSMRLIQLSRPFGDEAAISAGLDSAIGDYVVIMLPGMDPPAAIPQMVELSRQGSAVVTGVRTDRKNDALWSKMGSTLFYWYMHRILHFEMPRNGTFFRVLNRQAVNAITAIRDNYRYIRMMSIFVGYSNSVYPYQPVYRTGKHGRGMRESLNMAIDMIVVNSTHPLRIVSIIGLIASLLNLLYMGYVMLVNLLLDQVAEGWTTTSMQNAGMYFFILLILTVLSEYVGRILNETRSRPTYYVAGEKNSSVMLTNSDRRNVVDSPETNNQGDNL